MQYNVVKQKRKTATIAINEKQEVIVKVPFYMTPDQIQQLVNEHTQWIEETIKKKKEQITLHDWYITGQQLYLGEYWPVKIKVIYDGNYMSVFNRELGFVLTTNGSEASARREMEKVYRAKAKVKLKPMVDWYAKLLGVEYQKITIRKQVTRWGSCSAKGNLSFNLKIMCAPVEMIQYVVLHEVTHLKHFNHSKAFWQEIERWMPDYKERMNYFNQFGQNFMV